jgi:integrase
MALYKQVKQGKEGRIFWFEFSLNGQRIRESTGETTRTKALAREHDRREELNGGGHVVRRDKMRRKLFPLAAKEWFAAKEAKWSASYKSIQTLNIEHLNVYFGKRLLIDIGPDDIGKYQAKQRSKDHAGTLFRTGKGLDKHGKPNPVSARTINMEVSTIRLILKWAKLWRAIQDDVKMLPERKKVGKALTAEQANKLLEACRKSPQPSLYTAVLVFCNTALRNGELRKAKWGQVDFLKEEFTVGMSKTEGSSGRVVPLNETALEALKAWKTNWPKATAEDYVFPSQKLKYVGKGSSLARGKMVPYDTDLSKPVGTWKKSWASAQKAAGVKARIHDLRHHANTIMAEAGVPISTLKSISGWMTTEMSEHYTHVRDTSKRKAVDALGAANVGMIQ